MFPRRRPASVPAASPRVSPRGSASGSWWRGLLSPRVFVFVDVVRLAARVGQLSVWDKSFSFFFGAFFATFTLRGRVAWRRPSPSRLLFASRSSSQLRHFIRRQQLPSVDGFGVLLSLPRKVPGSDHRGPVGPAFVLRFRVGVGQGARQRRRRPSYWRRQSRLPRLASRVLLAPLLHRQARGPDMRVRSEANFASSSVSSRDGM